MNFSATEIVTLIGSLVAIVTAIWSGRTAKTANKKTEAETVKLYQDIADKCAESKLSMEDALQGQIDELRLRLDSKDVAIEDLRKALELKDGRIKELEEKLEIMNDTLALKDARIQQLEKLDASREREISQLRGEVNRLRQLQQDLDR